jgi:hypothetical protein
MEKILDSRRFGRRRRLQYLVKWEGYPDSDNMWIDKDNVFAEDKIREFKTSNPEAETHIRASPVAKFPHSSTFARSHLLHQHALRHMSSDGHNNFADKRPASVPPSSLATVALSPLVDRFGMVIPRTPPSPTPPPTLLFGDRVEDSRLLAPFR